MEDRNLFLLAEDPKDGTLEARAHFCFRCSWLDVDPATLVLKTVEPDRVMQAAPESVREASHCPECGHILRFGWIRATIGFTADGEKPDYLRRAWRWWRYGIDARAEAKHCYYCGWIGADGASLMEMAAQGFGVPLDC